MRNDELVARSRVLKIGKTNIEFALFRTPCVDKDRNGVVCSQAIVTLMALPTIFNQLTTIFG